MPDETVMCVTKTQLKMAIQESLQEFGLSPDPAFFVDRVTHYSHHQFLGECITKGEEKEKNCAFVTELRGGVVIAKRSMWTAVGAAVFAILALGVSVFIKQNN